MLREDYIHRMIRQLGEALARLAGRRGRGEYRDAIDEAGRLWDELLGVPRALVEVVDSPSLAELLREPARIRAAAELLAEEARALAGSGDPVNAAVCYRRAFELMLEARALAPEPGDDATLLELSRFVPPGEIDARYR
ncbi:MAG TPA: hypothetical protein VLX92_30525 [Kofleriaceae bacterium]|nr:hypothetical protein [Kofleriaceae bacterium]